MDQRNLAHQIDDEILPFLQWFGMSLTGNSRNFDSAIVCSCIELIKRERLYILDFLPKAPVLRLGNNPYCPERRSNSNVDRRIRKTEEVRRHSR